MGKRGHREGGTGSPALSLHRLRTRDHGESWQTLLTV